MFVYVLEARGICAAITLGVYSSPEKARAAAVEVWPQTDGYHDLVTVKVLIDQDASLDWCRGMGQAPNTAKELSYEVIELNQ